MGSENGKAGQHVDAKTTLSLHDEMGKGHAVRMSMTLCSDGRTEARQSSSVTSITATRIGTWNVRTIVGG